MTKIETDPVGRPSPAALQRVFAILKESADVVACHTSRIPCPHGTGATVSISIDEGWLHLEAPLPRRRAGTLPGPRRSVRLLSSNAALRHGISYCVGARCRETYQIADFPLRDAGADRSQLLDRARALFDVFCDTLTSYPMTLSVGNEEPLHELRRPLTIDDEAGETARELCDRTGWAYSERGNGQLAITLDAPDQFIQAAAYLVNGHEFRRATTMEVLPGLSCASRHAIATFLLTATRMIRLARASITHDRVSCDHRWEVAWDEIPAARQFHFGLSALSVACQITVREVRGLCGDSVARAYLGLRKRTSRDTDP